MGSLHLKGVLNMINFHVAVFCAGDAEDIKSYREMLNLLRVSSKRQNSDTIFYRLAQYALLLPEYTLFARQNI